MNVSTVTFSWQLLEVIISEKVAKLISDRM